MYKRKIECKVPNPVGRSFNSTELCNISEHYENSMSLSFIGLLSRRYVQPLRAIFSIPKGSTEENYKLH